MIKAIFFSLLMIFFASCGNNQEKAAATGNATADAEIVMNLRDAYLFGYPLVVMDATRKLMTNVQKPVNSGRLLAPLNQLVSANTFPDDKFRDVVRPNCDTYYSMGWIDLSTDPMVLQLPNTNGRYVLFPMLDAWSNVFFSPGKRTTGTSAQTYLITPPGWTGEVPKGIQQVKSPTNTIWIIGRTQVNSAKDGATVVKKIQDGYKLSPLSAYGKPYTAPEGKTDPSIPAKAPNDVVIGMSARDYFNQLNTLMLKNPPAAADSEILKRLAPLGIAPGGSFDPSKFSQAVQDSLKGIPEWAKMEMARTGLAGSRMVNGWGLTQGLGSYGTQYTFRAGVSYGGLGANLDADAMYPASLNDADGEGYDGSKHNYVLHFDAGKYPPANAFWSLTLYDDNGFLCSNPINKFAIGDRDALMKNKDGSIDIFIQNNNPGVNKKSNWLPAPKGSFNLLLRVYWPKEEMLKGAWAPPGVTKAK